MLSHRIACASLCLCAAASNVVPAGALALPGLRHQTRGEVGFISGGVGEREREALNNISNAYTLFVVLASEGGAYLADVDVSVRNRAGETVLETRTRGPFLLVDLPVGQYALDASVSGERTVHTTVEIGPGRLERTVMTFPRGES